MFEEAGRSADREAARRAAAGDSTARAWAKGAEGERRVAMTLETLEPHGVVAIHDRLLRRSGRANIDHVAVGPAGVYVIDAKHYDGRLWVGDHAAKANGVDLGDLLRAVRRQAAHVADALRAAGVDAGWVTPVLCVVGDARPGGGHATVQGVEIVDAGGLRRLMRGAPRRLASDQIRHAVATIERAFPPAAPPAAPGSSRRPPARLRPPQRRGAETGRPWTARPPSHGSGMPGAVGLALRVDGVVRGWTPLIRLLAWCLGWPVLVAARIVAQAPGSLVNRVVAAAVLAVGGALWYVPNVASSVP